MALRYGLGTATPLVARPKAELQNERRRFWDERHGLPLIVVARPTGVRSSDAYRDVFEAVYFAPFVPFTELLTRGPICCTSFLWDRQVIHETRRYEWHTDTTTVINGDKAFALLAAPRRRPEVPRAAIRNALKSNPGLRLGSRQTEHGRVAVRARAQAHSKIAAWARALDSAKPRFRNCAATAHVSPAAISTASFRIPKADATASPTARHRT